MAEEVKKIITVEVGKSITSVRDFKKHIEDLRGALLGLNEESEEYKTIAEQIATDQAKLNEVMKVGKTNTDSAAGSYNELNNQLKALRQQYKALSETERNGATGQALLSNINKLDNQLKDIDESMGVYNRNVGNYKNAFIDAFNTISQQVGKVNPGLGTLLSSAQRLVPAFLEVGKTAKATGSIMKAAMSSTGIGLLVVALGEIITHWESIARVVSRVLGLQNQYTSAVKMTKEQMQALATAAGDVDINLQNALDKARGLTDVEAATNRLTEAQNKALKILQEQERLGSTTKTFVDNLQEDFDKNNTGRIIENARALSTELIYIEENYTDATTEEGKARLNAIQSIRRDLDKTNDYNLDETLSALQDLKTFIKDEDEIYNQRTKDQTERINKREEELSKAKDMEKANFEGRLKQTEKYGKSQSQILRDQYILDREYINKNYKDNTELRDKLLGQLEKEFKHNLNALGGGYTDDGLQNILDRLKDFGKTELDTLYNRWQEERSILIKHHEDTSKLDAEYYQNREEIIKKNAEEENRILQEAYEAQEQLRRDNYNKAIQDLYDREDKEIHNAQLMWTKNTSPNTGWNFWDYMFGKGQDNESKIREQIDKIFEIRSGALQDQINAYSQYLGTLKEGSDEYIEIERQKTQAIMELDDLRYEHAVELNDSELRMQERKRDAIKTIMSNTVSIYSSFTDMMLVNEEQGSNKWKAFKTSEAVVNMLSGILAAFMSGFNSGLPAPWNIALAASTAGVAAAAGAAQIAQIQATKMGSTSSASNAITGGGSAGVGVSPLLNPDYDLQRMTNLSLQSDAYLPGKTQVYVLESDIQEVGNRVQVRENNATF